MRLTCLSVVVAMAALAGCATQDAGTWEPAMARYEVRFAASHPAGAVEGGGPQGRRRPRYGPSVRAWPSLRSFHGTHLQEDGTQLHEHDVYVFTLAEGGRDGDPQAPRRKRQTAPGWGKGKPGQLEYVPWQNRVGKAYPGYFGPSLGRWGQEMPETLWDDGKSIVSNKVSVIALVAAGVAGAAISGDLDDRVEDHYNKHGSQLGEDLDSIGGFFGNPALHLPAAFVYVIAATSTEDEELYENSTTLLNALCVNGIVVQGLKWSLGGESPNGDEMGWPSGHSSSTFCLATVMYHQHGPWVGVPLLGFATFVAYQRVDARNHDFSDVVSGSLIGIAIGHAVASKHETRVFGMDVVPYVDPDTGAVGVALTKQW